MKGNIIKYFSYRGFGFIAPEDSKDEIFFHVTSYPEEVQPEIGKDVEFEVVETPKGKEATNIRVLDATPADEPVEAETSEEANPEASVLGIGEINGVSKVIEEKLRGVGFDTVESIASIDADTISEKTGMSTKVADKLVASAKELLE